MDEQERDPLKQDIRNLTLAGWLIVSLACTVWLIGMIVGGIRVSDLGFREENVRLALVVVVMVAAVPAAIVFGVGYALLSSFNIPILRQQAKYKTDEQELDFKTPTLPGCLLFVPSIIISIAGMAWALDLGFHGWAQTLAGCLGFIPGLIVFLLGCALLSWLKIPVFPKKKREN
jgi:hypothetical protein